MTDGKKLLWVILCNGNAFRVPDFFVRRTDVHRRSPYRWPVMRVLFVDSPTTVQLPVIWDAYSPLMWRRCNDIRCCWKCFHGEIHYNGKVLICTIWHFFLSNTHFETHTWYMKCVFPWFTHESMSIAFPLRNSRIKSGRLAATPHLESARSYM